MFAGRPARTGNLLLAARHAMYALDDTAHELIRLGGAPLFALPDFAADEGVGPAPAALAAATPEASGRFIDDRLGPEAAAVVQGLADGGSGAAAEAVARHYEALQRMLHAALRA